jgi:hypothetical protein
MASYNQKFNQDDAIIRHVLIGLLADLNNKVYFYRQISADNREVIDIPFYYSITGDDQFLRDNFLFTTPSGEDCHPDKAFADSNYDVIPRGVVNLTGMSIDSGNLVNKRNMGTYTKINSEGAMEGYQAEFEMVPIVLRVDVEILVSSMLDSLKITEMLIKRLYKSNYFNVEVGHLNEATYRLNSYYAMPDDYDTEKPIDFTFDDKDKYKITFPIEINTSIPSFEWDSEMHIGNRMYEINMKSVLANGSDNPQKETVVVNPKGPTATIQQPTLGSTKTSSGGTQSAPEHIGCLVSLPITRSEGTNIDPSGLLHMVTVTLINGEEFTFDDRLLGNQHAFNYSDMVGRIEVEGTVNGLVGFNTKSMLTNPSGDIQLYEPNYVFNIDNVSKGISALDGTYIKMIGLLDHNANNIEFNSENTNGTFCS